MAKLFPQFPKKRPELPKAYAELYLNHYRNSREGRTTATSLAGKMESWMHRKVAEDCQASRPQSTLEIGAGTLNHLAYEPHSRPYDIVEPFRELFRDSSLRSQVRSEYHDIEEVEKDRKYERIISIATFEHLEDLPGVCARAVNHLAAGGNLRVAIPDEGGWLWSLGWRLTTAIEFRLRYGLSYQTLMRYEHLNRSGEIREVLEWFFDSVKVSRFGLGRIGAFYVFLDCRMPRADRAVSFLASRQ